MKIKQGKKATTYSPAGICTINLHATPTRLSFPNQPIPTGMLEEVRPEVESSKHGGLIPRRRKGATQYDVVFSIIAGGGEIIVIGVHSKRVRQARYVVFTPLQSGSSEQRSRGRVRGLSYA